MSLLPWRPSLELGKCFELVQRESQRGSKGTPLPPGGRLFPGANSSPCPNSTLDSRPGASSSSAPVDSRRADSAWNLGLARITDSIFWGGLGELQGGGWGGQGVGGRWKGGWQEGGGGGGQGGGRNMFEPGLSPQILAQRGSKMGPKCYKDISELDCCWSSEADGGPKDLLAGVTRRMSLLNKINGAGTCFEPKQRVESIDVQPN